MYQIGPLTFPIFNQLAFIPLVDVSSIMVYRLATDLGRSISTMTKTRRNSELWKVWIISREESLPVFRSTKAAMIIDCATHFIIDQALIGYGQDMTIKS